MPSPLVSIWTSRYPDEPLEVVTVPPMAACWLASPLAVGKHGSIAVVERFIRTTKDAFVRRLTMVPLGHKRMLTELRFFAEWYNAHWPQTTLKGRTPNEVCENLFPACRRPRYESRARWPRGSPCAAPRAPVRGKAGARVELEVTHDQGRKHLPIVSLRRVA